MRTSKQIEAWWDDPINQPTNKQLAEDIRLGKRDLAGHFIRKLTDGRIAIEMPGGGWVVPTSIVGEFEEIE